MRKELAAGGVLAPLRSFGGRPPDWAASARAPEALLFS